ncbi:MAG TPA: class I SAM-dependent methyltransferase [Candidatus Angelobacter sp.]|nr:class I SAM-dependent methyltransferase [Candidatus Angelobacter sp.]
MEPSSVEIDKIVQEFDGDACEFCERYKNKGLSRSSKLLLKFILDNNVRHRTVLDLGCGAGGLSLELLKEGASNTVGFDLSPKMISAATELAQANGLESRAKFQLGNGASSELPTSDIVLMDKVLCCYSEWRPLLKNAIDASRAMLGFTVPRDDGITKLPFRLALKIVNYFQRRRGGVLFYLHPLGTIDRTLRESGFNRHRKQGSRFWLVFLYSRA